MIRYVRIWLAQLQTSVAGAMQYRANFFVEIVLGLLANALTLVPILILFDRREVVAGWDRPSALMVMAYFMGINAVAEGCIGPSMMQLVHQVRSGAFDYVLLKPADSQFLATMSSYQPERVFNLLAAIAVAVFAFVERGHPPSPSELALGIGLFITGALSVYALFVMCGAAAFWVIRIDGVLPLLGSILDTARWPVHLYRGIWRAVFTFVIPISIMTTFPAMAMLGKLDAHTALATFAGAIAMLVVSRLVWMIAIRSYTSASS